MATKSWTLREFKNENGGKLQCVKLPGQSFTSIMCGSCYLAFAKTSEQADYSPSQVQQFIKDNGNNLDVLEGTTSEGAVCYTIVEHKELDWLDCDF